MIKLSDNFEMNAIDYANEGNSDIGIRGSGKTHTATAIAEGLMDNNIPIVVFDPSGVWGNLRYGVNGNKGYPIVVAGGAESDLELTAENAVNILEAAMKENISVVFDLSEIDAKSKEIRIVAYCVEHLMRYNKGYKTLRHVFIEEAAEYCPQKLNPGLFVVYSQIERMARIGRNNGLGFTLINQRSQEIAKAIFELCDRVFVHRQVGNNSLSTIDTWLKYKGIEDKNDIIKSLPKLNPGQCWIIDLNGEHQVKVLPKKTFHPDPKKGIVLAPAGSEADISGFIEKMREAMGAVAEVQIASRGGSKTNDQLKKLQHEINELKTQNNLLLEHNQNLTTALAGANDKLRKISEITGCESSKMTREVPVMQLNKIIESPKRNVPEESTGMKVMEELIPAKVTKPAGPVGGSALRILKTVAMFHPKPVSKTRVGLITDLSTTSGSFGTYIATLKREGLMTVSNNEFSITQAGLDAAGDIGQLPTGDELLDMWCKHVGGTTGKILGFLADQHPESVSKEETGASLGISHTSGSFGTYIATLKRNGLITVTSGMLRASDELFF